MENPKSYVKYELRYLLMEKRHIEWARRLHNHDNTLFQLKDPEHISEYQQEAWFENLSKSHTSKRYVVNANGDDIGVFRIDAIDLKNHSVMVGLDLSQEWRGKGLAKLIYGYFLDYYFDQCGMNRVYLKVLETNTLAKHVYESVGFKEEGRDRQAVFRDGRYRDFICMSILKGEYNASKNGSTQT